MLYRKIGNRIEEYLSSGSNRMLLIDGARQIGKSYIIRYIGEKMFSNYIEINMEEDKLGDRIFADAKTTNDFYMALSIIAGNKMKERENTLVFIDEIQAYDHLLTLVKFLMKEKRFTYIASGSLLGVTLKNTQSVPIGSLDVQHMYPMDFEEFLYANGVGKIAIDAMRESFNKQEALSGAMHNKMMDLFKKYLLVESPIVITDKQKESLNSLMEVFDKDMLTYWDKVKIREEDGKSRLETLKYKNHFGTLINDINIGKSR